MIRFSIVIPLYNKELSIRETLLSVLNQTYQKFEVVVVNDGSTDSSLSVVESISDKRIKIINTENKGVSSARNTGIKSSSYDYIVFLDADDIWYSNCLAEFKYLIDNFPKASIFCTSHTLSIKDIRSRERCYYIDNYYKATAESYARDTIALLCTGCVTVKKECFSQTGVFNESLSHGEDLDMWERLASEHVYAKSEIVTMKYRLDAENRSDKTVQKKINKLKKVIRQDIHDKYQRLDYGRIYFFHIYTNIRQRKNGKESLCLFFKYGDWIVAFIYLIVKKRFFNSSF